MHQIDTVQAIQDLTSEKALAALTSFFKNAKKLICPKNARGTSKHFCLFQHCQRTPLLQNEVFSML